MQQQTTEGQGPYSGGGYQLTVAPSATSGSDSGAGAGGGLSPISGSFNLDPGTSMMGDSGMNKGNFNYSSTAPLSPGLSGGAGGGGGGGELRSILKKSSSPTPNSSVHANGRGGSGGSGGHNHHYLSEYSSVHQLAAEMSPSLNSTSTHAQPGQYEQFHSDLNKSLEEKLRITQ